MQIPLYTGIPLIEFHTLVSCLQTFAPASSSVPIVDQILMTLMKIRQNFVMADLAQWFKTSQDQVSKTVGIWIDIMSEHCLKAFKNYVLHPFQLSILSFAYIPLSLHITVLSCLTAFSN